MEGKISSGSRVALTTESTVFKKLKGKTEFSNDTGKETVFKGTLCSFGGVTETLNIYKIYKEIIQT